MLTPRIHQLREQSLQAINSISAERAILLTDFYEQPETGLFPVAIQRARAFEYILQHKTIYIGQNELIVGERGHCPKAVPTYPEISLHSLADLDMLDSRQKVAYCVDEDTKKVYAERIIPFWKGKSQRERIFNILPEEWKSAYAAGIFTEFQEQRAPGHTVAGKDVFAKGMICLIEEINESRKQIRPEETHKIHQLDAMEISAKALILFAKRHADKLRETLVYESSEERRNELLDMIRVCERVPAHAPETFHEALQHYWFIHIGVITELNPWDSFNPGRLDQHLLPFYQKEIAEGSLTKERAIELLQAFWIKFNNHPAPPKVGVTALESSTYTDFALINLGGLTEDGEDAVNEMSFILLDVIEEMRLLQPSSMVQISRKNPDNFIKRALKIAATGFGQPSFFNTDGIVKQLMRQGKSLADARNGGASGCVETGAFGTEAYTLSGYFNLNKVLEITLYNGFDPRTQKQIGLKTGDSESFKNFEAFYQAFEAQLKHFISIKINGNNQIEQCFAENMPAPFLSLLINDCIANARDYNAGGARYNTSYVQGVGLGSITDNFASIEKWVFNDRQLTMTALISLLKDNFEGHEHWQQKFIYESPKWGNNDEQADKHAVRVFNSFFNAVDGLPSFRGGVFRINMLPTTSHVYFGSVTGAMPDGRECGRPLSEGISPVQGADTKGPVAVLQSASRIDHLLTGGTLLNQKFTPEYFKTDEAMSHITALIRTYFRLNGHHIQFNVVNADTLIQARQQPELFRDLIVRVAGYSDYFNDLGDDLQDEIIRRTAHETT